MMDKKINNELGAGSGTGHQRGLRLSLGRPIIAGSICLIVLLLALVGHGLLRRNTDDKHTKSNNMVCGDDIRKQARSAIHEGQLDEVILISEEIRDNQDYVNDKYCLYIVAVGAVNGGDVINARSSIDMLKQKDLGYADIIKEFGNLAPDQVDLESSLKLIEEKVKKLESGDSITPSPQVEL